MKKDPCVKEALLYRKIDEKVKCMVKGLVSGEVISHVSAFVQHLDQFIPPCRYDLLAYPRAK